MRGNKQKRTKLGKWLDQNGIEQKELETATKVSRSTITRLCNDKNHVPALSIVPKRFCCKV
ncbi:MULTISPECIES: helix-turn-helix domain-containing protein [Bacillus]|uniref:helix-turn-helix domain-containing protein n=1 Tax=Bacillus TaxID=1386 RepID=UPI00077B11ED|nr:MULTISPECIES: helix-turn-helix domain-containing protein [Bacillus cereus group]KXY81104.1 XRE family transcriptional regulator [Bacillus cereus]MBG9935016.1 XRE family transcriptional regulator [Bacillus tropicus]MED2997372.1 helix-turn-helix domain-containing protein [Bacillus tropicus]OTY62311.1 transcriptional regulator [Bacillus thuringiensis serovar graciosensis]